MNSENEKILDRLKKASSCVYVNDIYRLIVKQKSKHENFKVRDNLSVILIFVSRIIISGFLMFLNIAKKKDMCFKNEIGFARVPRTSIKLKRIKDHIQIISDDINNHDFTMYQMGNRLNRLRFVVFIYVNQCIEDYKDIFQITSDELIHPYKKKILKEMVKRIPHTVVYKYFTDYVIKNYRCDTIMTGQMYDRYALIEDQISSNYGKELVCIPHGVESTLEMPVGYVGSKFYCTSEHMCMKLRDLYSNDKYLYSNEVTEKTFKVVMSNSGTKKFVYFTQPTNQSQILGIIKVMSDYLNSVGNKLYLKLHPLDNKKYYNGCNIEIISDFNQAIQNNVCIGTASTVLLESIYNDSLPISIINVIEPDRLLDGNYEFLNDDRIIKPKGLTELIEILNENIVYHKTIKEENNE